MSDPFWVWRAHVAADLRYGERAVHRAQIELARDAAHAERLRCAPRGRGRIGAGRTRRSSPTSPCRPRRSVSGPSERTPRPSAMTRMLRQHRLRDGVGARLRLDASGDAHRVSGPSDDADAAVPLPVDGDRPSAQLHGHGAHLARPPARVVGRAVHLAAVLEPVGVTLLARDLRSEDASVTRAGREWRACGRGALGAPGGGRSSLRQSGGGEGWNGTTTTVAGTEYS